MPNKNNSDARLSIISGFRFKFTIDEKELLYLASAWTGKESILYDGVEVSSLQSFKKHNSHYFVINDATYKATLITKGLINRNWNCCLYCEDRKIKCFSLYLKEPSFWHKLLYGFIFALILHLTPKSLWFVCIPLMGVAVARITMNSLVYKVDLGD